MQLSPLAKMINDEKTYESLKKWTSLHQRLEDFARNYQFNTDKKREIEIELDKSELDKIDKTIREALDKYFK